MGMFKKLFTPAPRAPSSSKKKKPNEITSQKEGELASKRAMDDADRELYQFTLPKDERGFTDLISSHKSGTRFQYVALTGKNEETYEARIRRLVTFQPRYNKDAIPFKDLPKLRLTEQDERFPLTSAFPKKGKDYVRLASVTICYIPLSSAIGTYTKVRACLIDTRLLGDQVVQSAKFNSNFKETKELTMDYCIPRENIDKIILTFTIEQRTMEYGHQYGACQLMLQLEESDFPYIEDFKEVAGTTSMPPAVLEEFETNPRHMDTTVLENHRENLRQMYLNNEIVDEIDPIETRTAKMKYAKSSAPIRDKPKGERDQSGVSSRQGWEHMKGFVKPEVPIDQASIDTFESNEEDNEFFSRRLATPPMSHPKRSSMKTPRQGSLFSNSTVVDEDEDDNDTVPFVPVSSPKGVKFEHDNV